MNGEPKAVLRGRRTRAEVQQLVSEFPQRNAAECILPQSRFELEHAGSPSEEAPMEAEEEKLSRRVQVAGCGVGRGEIPEERKIDYRVGLGVVRRVQDRGAARCCQGLLVSVS